MLIFRLEPGSLKVLGGKVEALYEKWETSQKMAKFTRNFARNRPSATDTEGPPAWIPFGKKVGRGQAQNFSEADKNFKALPSTPATLEAKESKEGKVTHTQCGNYGNSLSRIFGKNFVKVTVLLNKLLKS